MTCRFSYNITSCVSDTNSSSSIRSNQAALPVTCICGPEWSARQGP